MSNCEQRELYLDRRIDTSTEDRAVFESHLQECDDCRLSVASWKRIDATIRISDGNDPDPRRRIHLRARLLERVGNRRPASLARLRWALAACATAVAVVILLVVQPGERTTDVQDRSSQVASATLLELQLLVLDGEIQTAPPQPARIGQRLHAKGQRRLLAQIGSDRVGIAPGGSLRIADASRQLTQIQLQSGTAAFGVVPHVSSEAVFVVQSGDLRVEVVGTQFSVTRLTDAVDVNLLAGRVRVTAADETHECAAGEQMRFFEHGSVERRQLDRDSSDLIRKLLADPSQSRVKQEKMEETTQPDLGKRKRRQNKDRRVGPLDKLTAEVVAGRCGQAVPALRAFLKREPRRAAAWSLLADCQRRLQRWTAAVSAYRRIITIGDRIEANRARFLAASILQDHLSDDQGAIDLLKAYLKAGGTETNLDAAARVRQAKSLRSVGRQEQAEKILKRVVSDYPGTPAAKEAAHLLR